MKSHESALAQIPLQTSLQRTANTAAVEIAGRTEQTKATRKYKTFGPFCSTNAKNLFNAGYGGYIVYSSSVLPIILSNKMHMLCLWVNFLSHLFNQKLLNVKK